MSDDLNQTPAVGAFKSRGGLRRIVGAASNSVAGLVTAWRIEHAFRQELFVVLPGVVVALLLPVGSIEKLILIGSLVLVLIVELLNSAIEATVDRISLDRHPLSKNAKDFGSAAVMLTFLLALAAWLVVIWPLVFEQ